MDFLLEQLCAAYPPAESVPEEHRTLKARGMTFRIRGFYAEGFGHVSAMTASGFMGLMKMDTLILNPFERDMPLLSYDRIHAMGRDTLCLELYDTMLNGTDLSLPDRVAAGCRDLPSYDPGSHWYDSVKLPQCLYKRGGKAHRGAFSRAAADMLAAYLKTCENAAGCDRAAKQAKAAVYSEGLLAHGGPAVDVFTKKFGYETTAQLFRTVLFGC